MRLTKLLDGITVKKLFHAQYGTAVITSEIEVNNICYDSRSATRGDLFVAIKGLKTDGHKFLQDAIGKGVKTVIIERDNLLSDAMCRHYGVMKIVVNDGRAALSRLAANYFKHPTKSLNVIGITGTNGKTTTCYLIESIIKMGGEKTGLIGTIEYRVGDEVLEPSHTTPESLELHNLFNRMKLAKCGYVPMEVSSHALALRRVDDVNYSSAIFTNLTQEHMDFHSSMEDYFNVKKRLFMMLNENATAVTNIDSEYGKFMVEDCGGKVVTYGRDDEADVRLLNSNPTFHGTDINLSYRGEEVRLQPRLLGRFNISNVLAAYTWGRAAGFDSKVVKEGIEKLTGVRGRFEPVPSPTGWTAIIDYSHTPDALHHTLTAIKELQQKKGRTITVFGCGGDRDREKRPLMGEIAAALSDTVIVTSDNPRTEKPEKIIKDILNGIEDSTSVEIIADREKAIRKGLDIAGKGDVILIAGKGHETYQIIGDERLHFNDREVVEKWISKN